MSQFYKGPPSGGVVGNVTGPASSTDNAIARFDGTTGKIIQNSSVTIDDNGNIDLTSTVSGGTNYILVENNLNTADTSTKISQLVGGTSAGDVYDEFIIGTTQSYAWGIDNSDGQTFKLTTDGSGNVTPSSGTTLIDITTAGQVSFPEATLTENGLMLVGASGLLESLGEATDGQIPIGSTGANPVLATITEGSGISVTNGAGSITIAAGATVATSYPTDAGTATPAANTLSILGGEAIDTSAAANVITISCEDWSTTNKGVGTLATDATSYLLASTTDALSPSNIGAVLAVEQQSGFQEWTGAGSHYTVAGTTFTLDRPGIGWVNSKRVTWLGGQGTGALAAGSCHYVYIDSTGTIGTTTTRTTSLFQDNIVLFEVLVDASSNVIVTKENHSLQTHPSTMNALHQLGMHGYDVVGQTGGTIALNGIVGIQVDGDGAWHDHDLRTTIPDSAGAAITFNIMYTNGAGKWVRQSASNTLPTQYNNAGTPTALAGNERTVFDIMVSKDDIESSAPQYFAIMDDAKYPNLAQAQAAVDNTSFATATNELAEIEMIRMGVVIMNATQIDEVIVSKQTIGTGNISQIGSEGSLISLDTSNFDGVLDAADTTVQSALDTLDDMFVAADFTVAAGSVSLDDDVLKALAGDAGVAAGSSHSITIAGGTGCSTSAAGSTVTINVEGDGLDWTRISGTTQALAVSNGYVATDAALTTCTLPATAALGAIIKIDGEGTGLIKVAQNASQQIHLGPFSTTAGVTGFLSSTHRRDCITLRCTVANTEFVAEEWAGNWGAT